MHIFQFYPLILSLNSMLLAIFISIHNALFLNPQGVARTSASFPSLFECLSPFFVGFLAHVFVGERLGAASDIIGLLLNVSGLFAVIFSKMRLDGPMSAIATASDKNVVNTDGMDAVLPDIAAVTAASAPPKGRLSLCRSWTLKKVSEEASSRPATPITN